MKKIIRNLNPELTSFRAFEENGERYLEGYGSVFNKRSKQLFENNRLFYEVISPRSFDEILQSEDLNVILNFNHSRDRVLARTKSGTLELSVDEVGLRFKAKVPNTTLGNDVYELVSRGDLFECSFAFIVKKDDEQWAKDEEGNNIRTINRIAKLYDVSIVTDGAYAGTPVYARNDEELEEKLEPEPGDSEEEFIGKCIKYVMDSGEADDVDQASAICYSKWEEKQKSLKEEEEQQIQKEEEEQKALQEATKEELQRMKIHIETLKLKFN